MEEEKPLSSEEKARIEVEVHAEKVRVWVDGATNFVTDERNQQLIVDVISRALDKWLDLHRRRLLERMGLYALGAIVFGALAVLGWKGWGGK